MKLWQVNAPGRVEVGFQPNPADHHATDVKVIDGLGALAYARLTVLFSRTADSSGSARM